MASTDYMLMFRPCRNILVYGHQLITWQTTFSFSPNYSRTLFPFDSRVFKRPEKVRLVKTQYFFFIPINEKGLSGAQWLAMLINIIKGEHCKCCKESLIATRATCEKEVHALSCNMYFKLYPQSGSNILWRSGLLSGQRFILKRWLLNEHSSAVKCICSVQTASSY